MTDMRGAAPARKIILDCEHILWMRPPLPNAGEILYCTPCGAYRPVGPTDMNGRVYESDFSWEKRGRLYAARCETPRCDYKRTSPHWYRLRDLMDSHYLRTHSGSSLVFGTPTNIPEIRIPRNSPPPF